MNAFLRRLASSPAIAALSKPRAYLPLLLAVLALAALASWGLSGAAGTVTLLFPRATDGRIAGELRALPAAPREARLARVLDELLLGPADPALAPLFAPDARVRAALLRDGVFYADLTEDALSGEGLPLRTALEAARRALRLAAPGLRDVRITIGGQVPYAGDAPAGPQKK